MNIEDLKETAALAHLNLDEAELAAAFPAAADGPARALGASGFRGDNASPGPRSGTSPPGSFPSPSQKLIPQEETGASNSSFVASIA